jgi:hypothetical protein
MTLTVKPTWKNMTSPPDELTAKDFRIIQSSRRGYHPNGKSEWLAAVKGIYEKDGNVFAGHLQDKYGHLYEQGVWIFGDWDRALRAAGLTRKKCESAAYRTKRNHWHNMLFAQAAFAALCCIRDDQSPQAILSRAASIRFLA